MNEAAPRCVADRMTRQVITLAEDDTLEKVEQGMGQFRLRHLPVVRGKKLVGLITHRDMLQISASSLSTQRAVRDHLIHQVPASRIMRTAVETARPDDSLAETGKRMLSQKIGCLCVLDDNDDLVGIITEADFVALAIELIGPAPASESA